MSGIDRTRNEILLAKQRIRELEKALAISPDDRGLVLMIRSMENRCRGLEIEFANQCAAMGTDVCRYRAFGPEVDVAELFLKSFIGFQNLYSVTYSAITRGARKSPKIPQDDLNKSRFQIEYTFAGSVGLMVSLPNTPVLGDMETDLDATFNAVVSMCKHTDMEAIRAEAIKYGPAVLQSLYKWSRTNAESNIGADISWCRKNAVRASVEVQSQEYARIRDALLKVTDKSTESHTVHGRLVGIDLESKRFHFVGNDDEHYHGAYGDAIGDDEEVPVGSHYIATMIRTFWSNVATEEEKEDWFLEFILPG